MSTVDLRPAVIDVKASAQNDVVITTTFTGLSVGVAGNWLAYVRSELTDSAQAASFTITTDTGANTVTCTLAKATAAALVASGARTYKGFWSLYNSSTKRTYLQGTFTLEQDPTR